MSVWTIHNTSGGKDKSNLLNCHIISSPFGSLNPTCFQLTLQSIAYVLSTTNTTTPPNPPFTFPVFEYLGYNWTFEVTTFTGGQSQNQAEGTWKNTDPNTEATDGESGEWTAQAGAGVGEDEPEVAASTTA